MNQEAQEKSTTGAEIHHGAVSLLGPPLPRNPKSRLFLAVKAALACLFALALDVLTGNPDHVTSTFVAIISVSPVVLMGLRRSLDQVVGSAIGGLWGAGAMLLGLEILAGIPLAVGAAVLSAFGLGFGRGYTVAAFSAMFVQAVPRGDAMDTLEVRVLAVGTAAISAFMVNVLVSAAAYRGILKRRMRFAESTVSALLVRAGEEGPAVVRAGFPVIAELEEILSLAHDELRLRRDHKTVKWVAALAERAGTLRRLLHLVLDLVYRLEEEQLPPDAMQEWLRWLLHEGGEEPPVPEPLVATTQRIRRLGKTLAVSSSSGLPSAASTPGSVASPRPLSPPDAEAP